MEWQVEMSSSSCGYVVVADFPREGKVGRGSVLIDEDGVQPVDDAKDGYSLTGSGYTRDSGSVNVSTIVFPPTRDNTPTHHHRR
ncbi:Uncharacterized protein DBV15_00661 [Temnothorax longispinosus]|uniref:Uncharacterized protein n=1 Tax=Temnothorax longispinosus TaxID=300112 RepID=A0A4V6RGJ9_9HYME|nr:Uncharacterized protein DBV15_00661 [Temnothorax longispinosus]